MTTRRLPGGIITEIGQCLDWRQPRQRVVLVHRPDGRDLDMVHFGEAVTCFARCLVAS